MKPPNDSNVKRFDRITFLLLFSFVLSVAVKLMPKDHPGSSDSIMLFSLSSVFDLLTIVFLIAFIVRAVTR